MGESAEELKLKMQTAESILNDATAINHISGTQNGFGSVENNVDSGGDNNPNGNSNHNASSHKYKEENSSSSSKPKDGSSSSSKHKDHHSSSSSSKHKEGHKSSSSSSKHKDGHSSSSSKPKDGSSSSSSKPKDGSSSTPSKSSSDKQKDSHSKDKHHSSSDKKHSSSEHKSHSKSSSSDKHRDGTSKSSSDKPKDGTSKSSSSGEKHRDGSSKSSSSGDKHSSKSSSSDKHRDSSSKSSSDKHKDSSKSSSSDKHKDGSGKSSSSSDKHKDSSSRPASDKHKDGSKSLSDKHKDGSSRSSSDKHKDGGSKSSSDKHRDGSSKTSSSSDKHRDGSKSSSSDKHKDANKSPDKHKDRSKESSSSDKHKDRARDVSSSMSPDKCSSSPDKYSSSPEKHSGSDHHRESSKLAENGADFVSESVARRISLEDEMKPVSIKLEKIEMNREEMHVEHVKKDLSSDEDEVPLSARIKMETAPGKRRYEESSDDEPLSARMQKVKKVKKEVKEEDDDFKPSKKRKTEEEEEFVPVKKKKIKNKVKEVKVESKSVMKAKKKAQEEQQVWKWWEEEKRDDGIKWTFLEHKGPVFAPLYDRLPKKVKFHYNGKEMQLSEATEEVAGFYAKMLDHDYTGKEVFNNNFFKDWRKVMSKEEKEIITDLSKCNFKELNTFFLQQSEERKNRTKEQKQELKKQNEEITKEYGFCTIDGHTEKIGNFRIEPPGLFRGRGDHPKQGRLKKRVEAEEVIINCSKNSKIPTAPEGHKWKEVRHDNSVTWLASWTENIQGATKYVMLNAASKLKGEKDWQKYEIARKLHKCVDKIRATYREDWKSKEMRVRQRAVALYFIDKLALRAGNEKEEGETADTVGCCSLRVEHIHLFTEKEGKECVVEFDFLGKDSIRYQNSVPVEKRVFKNLQLFVENKQQDDDLFDRLNTTLMNKHLHDLMEGLTAKVFRTYNASRTLQEQLDLLTNEEDPIAAKLLSYNRANRAVAILCNHQRSAPKTFAQSMENLMNKVEDKRKQVKDAKKDIKDAKSDYKNHNTERNRAIVDKKKNSLKRLEEQLTKLEVQATDKEENKEIALGTSKLNYLDPRISVAWCKKWDVPIEKVYNKTQRDKFRWAIDMATDDFKF